MNDIALIILAKRPVLGQVKTRLAATIGHEKALELYKEMLSKAGQLTRDWPGVVQVWLSGSTEAPCDMSWCDSVNDVREQITGDLGQRMQHAFVIGLNRPDVRGAIMIGTDCPDLQIEHLRQAARALDDHEVVFGPANDGGYYLIGLTKVHHMLFNEIPWSTPEVLQRSKDHLKKHEISFFELTHILVDIDEKRDLHESNWGKSQLDTL